MDLWTETLHNENIRTAKFHNSTKIEKKAPYLVVYHIFKAAEAFCTLTHFLRAKNLRVAKISFPWPLEICILLLYMLFMVRFLVCLLFWLFVHFSSTQI